MLSGVNAPTLIRHKALGWVIFFRHKSSGWGWGEEEGGEVRERERYLEEIRDSSVML